LRTDQSAGERRPAVRRAAGAEAGHERKAPPARTAVDMRPWTSTAAANGHA
jgi:hypothetical protein